MFPVSLLLFCCILKKIITGANVEPVGVIGSQLLVGAGLDKIDPLGDLELAGTILVHESNGSRGCV
jgi:hypothetical protein